MKPKAHPAIVIILVLSAAIPTVAAKKLDLDRVTPVPADQPIPTQDFFRSRALSRPVINRAGTHIAAVTSANDDKHMLFVFDIAKLKANTLGSTAEQDIYGVDWLGDKRLLFRVSSRKLYGLGIMAVNIDRLTAAYPLQQYCGSNVVSIPLHDPLSPVVWNRRELESDRDQGVVVLNSNIRSSSLVDLTVAMDGFLYSQLYHKVREQNQRTITRSYPRPTSGITYHYMADKTGELAYAFTSENGELSMHRLDGKNWIECPVDLENIAIVDNANDPGQLLVIGPSVDGQPNPLQLMDAASGKLGDVILDDQKYDFNGSTYTNPTNGDVLGVVFNKGGPRTYWFNEQYKALQKILDGMFPNLVVRIIGSDERHRMFLVQTYSDRQPTDYQWVNLETRQAGLFKKSAPWIDPQRMRPMNILKFRTRDDKELDAYLTLPAGASKQAPCPLVVLCHGGPWARDDWGFNGEVQFLAHHGYAVLQPNYRGSTGSVGRFPSGDKYDFVKMHHDVTDAVTTVFGTGVIDRGRVAIMGSSFGGYLAVAGVAHEANLYRCAVTIAGVFDWALQVQSEKYDQFDLPYYRRMIRVLGDPKVETIRYEAMSPIKHVRNIRVPVFVAGGKDDQTVEIQQSKNLIEEFERHDVPYQKLFIGGEGHGMAFLAHEVELYDRIKAFLDENLRPAQASLAAAP